MSWAKRTGSGYGQRGAPGYTFKKSRFRSKKPITSFRDLEDDQRSQEAARIVVQKVVPIIAGKGYPSEQDFIAQALALPGQIAEAHSRRFDDERRALSLLSDALEVCNRMVVYLEQVRDIYGAESDRVVCDENISRYMKERVKIRNLAKAWESWMLEKTAASSRKDGA